MATATEDGATTEAGKAAAKERVANQGKAHKPATRATPGKDAKSSAKRKVLTDDERIAKLEADLAEARKKREKKASEAQAKLGEKRIALLKRIEPLVNQLNELNGQLDYLPVSLVAEAEPKGRPLGGDDKG